MRSIRIDDSDTDNDGAAGDPVAIANKEAAAATDAITSRATLMAEGIINDAKIKAGQIVTDARSEVSALILSAREQVEEDRSRAWQEGFAEGSEEGRHSFDEQLAEKLQENDESLKRVLDEIYSEMARTYDGLEDGAKALALEIVRKVINPAEEELGNVFESLIKNALCQMSPDKKVVIRVSPGEYERVFPSGGAVFKLDSGVTVTASVFRDVALEGGGCIIDTEDTTVNVGLESQLKYIKLAFDQVQVYENN